MVMLRWAPRPVDLMVAGVLTVGTQVELWLGPAPGASRTGLAICYGVGTVAAAWHRVAPLVSVTVSLTALAVVPGALGVDPAGSFGWLVTVLAVLVSVGYQGRRPVLGLAVAAALVALSIVLQKGFAPADIAWAWLLLGGAWLAGHSIGSRTLRAQLAEERAQRAEQNVQWRMDAAVTQERLRIARELHDLTAHSISVMTLHASGVRRLLHDDQVAERAALEAVERTGRESLAEMHRLLGVLRLPATVTSSEPDDAYQPPARLAGVEELITSARVAGVEAHVRTVGDVEQLPAGVDLAAYRIVQEAVTNVLRHASATRLECLIEVGHGELRLQVMDDGRGPDPRGSDGHGFTGMRERVQMYGGSLQVGPQPGGGFAVRAVLPVAALDQSRKDMGP
jgi:signal transduction histidine kinase